MHLDPELGLEVAQEVAEVDVEQVTIPGDHDVVAVPVADAEHIRRHAAAGAGPHEVLCRGGRLRVGARGLVQVLLKHY